MLPCRSTPLESQMTLLGCGSSGGGGFSPLSLSPLIWLDATQLGLSDGASVAQFTDLSGNGNHFVQATTANKPTFRSSGINGKPAVEGDGVDDAMTLAAFGAQATWWGFITLRLIAIPAYGVVWGVNDYNPDANYILLEINASAQLRIGTNITTTTPNLAAVTGVNYSFLLAGSASAGSLKGDTLSPDSTRALNFSRANEASRLFNRGDSQPSNVRIGELVYGSGTLTADQQTALWTYASTKWGTSIP